MLLSYIISKNLEKVNNINEIDRECIIKAIQKNQGRIMINFDNIFRKGKDILGIENKGELLLEFRRYIEMLLRVDTILCVKNVYDNKISAINQENLLFHLDKKYYSDFQLCSFMDIFKIETNNYKKIFWGDSDIPPHLGAILKYVENHYNTTYRFFRNRNSEYHYIYTILYRKNFEIRNLIDILNAYHYEENEESLRLYNFGINEVKEKVENVVSEIGKIKNLI